MSEVFEGMSVTVLMGGNSAERAISLKSGGAVVLNAMLLILLKVLQACGKVMIIRLMQGFLQFLSSDTFVYSVAILKNWLNLKMIG